MDTLSIIKKESDDEVKIKCDGLDFYRHKDDVETGMTEMLDLKNGYHLSESNKERINKRPIEQEGRSLGQNSKQVNENKVFEQNRKRKYSERVCIVEIVVLLCSILSQHSKNYTKHCNLFGLK